MSTSRESGPLLDPPSRPRVAIALAALVALLLPAAVDAAATLTLVNLDGAGEGFNDPTPVDPVGGNAGTTLGQQRLNVVVYAMNFWGAILTSSVTIRIDGKFDPLSCSSLVAAGPITVHNTFAGAPHAGVWYPASLANALAGSDLDASHDDMAITTNSSLDAGSCLGGIHWWYGYTPPPDGDASIYLLPQVVHALAHGLGFQTQVASSGIFLSGLPDIFSTFLFDDSTSKYWSQMTDAERYASERNPSHVVWTGTNVAVLGSLFTAGWTNMGPLVFTPSTYVTGSSVIHWDGSITPHELLEPSVAEGLGCYPLTVAALRDMGWLASAPFACTGLLFADGFESGSYDRWSSSAF